MIKYRTEKSRWAHVSSRIEALEVVKETAKQVTYLAEYTDWITQKKGVRENKQAKESEYHRWHDTWEGAHAHLLALAENKVERYKTDLDKAESVLAGIKGMKKP